MIFSRQMTDQVTSRILSEKIDCKHLAFLSLLHLNPQQSSEASVFYWVSFRIEETETLGIRLSQGGIYMVFLTADHKFLALPVRW